MTTNLFQKFLNGKNMNIKVNWWSLELTTYITFECILCAWYKAADCLSWLVEVPNSLAATSILINMALASAPDRPATCTCGKTKTLMDTMPPADILSPSQQDTAKGNIPPPLLGDQKEILLQMQKTDLFCKHISKWLLNGKAPHHKAGTFTHINSLLHKHAIDTTQKFMVSSWDHGISQYSSKYMINWATKTSTGLNTSSNSSTTGKEWTKTSANTLQTAPSAKGKRWKYKCTHCR